MIKLRALASLLRRRFQGLQTWKRRWLETSPQFDVEGSLAASLARLPDQISHTEAGDLLLVQTVQRGATDKQMEERGVCQC